MKVALPNVVPQFLLARYHDSHDSQFLQPVGAKILKLKRSTRSELGEDLEIVMLEMTAEEQEERVRARHEGSQDAVDLMKVGGTEHNVIVGDKVQVGLFIVENRN